MTMKNFSLRSKIVLGGILIVLVPLVIVGAVTFINSSRTLEDVSKVQTVQIAKSLSKMIQLAIERELNFLSATAKDPLIIDCASRQDYDGLVEKIADLYQKMGAEYEGIGIFDQQGIIRADAVDKRRVGISVAEREYIKSARQGKTGIGPVTPSKATGQPIFGIVAPIMSKDGNYLGCVLGVLKADFLAKHILSLKLGQTGYAMMIDHQGIIIAHPNPDYILKLDTLKDPALRENTKRMIRGETGTGEYTYRGIAKIVGFTPVALTGWTVGVIQNKGEVMALAYANRNLILIVSGIFLLMTVLAVFFLSGTISSPVQKTLTTLNQAIEQAVEAILIIGLDRKVQYVNPAMARIVDRPVRDLVGKIPNLENTDIANREEMWKIIEEGKIWSGRVRGIRKNSTDYSLDMTVTPVRDEAGKINCFLAIGKDITKELMMESQLRQSQKMEAIGTLAGGIAHDFNNILSAVFGYAELTLNSLQDKEKSRHYVDEILKAAARARELVNHILMFSRQSEQQKQLLKPRHIVKEVLRLLRASLPTTIEIRQDIKSDASILADPTQIHQVVMNLCTNAGHAMKQGGILEVILDDIEVNQAFALRHEGMKPGRHVALKVADSGSGIPPEIADRIFDPFFTTKPQGKGTGLGLSVVHGIVKALNGAITVSSEPGKGATFIVYLPVSDMESRYLEGDVEEDVPGGSERLLLVDDEDAIVQTGEAMLKDLGYRVSGFTESAAALKAFCRDPMAFDAIITDYTMPHMTGEELTKKIREVRKDIPIMMWSGYMDQDIEFKIKNTGITAFIKKPVSRHDLAAALRRILEPPAFK